MQAMKLLCLQAKRNQVLTCGRVCAWRALFGISLLVLSLWLPSTSADSEEAESAQNIETQSAGAESVVDGSKSGVQESTEVRYSSVCPAAHTAYSEGSKPDTDLCNSGENPGEDISITCSNESSELFNNTLCGASDNATNVTLSEITVLRPKCEDGKGCDEPLHCLDFKTLDPNASIIPDPPQAVLVTPHKLENILEVHGMPNCCAVVLFYAPWCAFSIQFARKFNALGRSFENLPIMAVDLAENEPHKYILAYLPVVAFYYGGKTLFKFKLESSFEDLRDIVSNVTGFTPLVVNLTDSANAQPVPTLRDASSDHVTLSLALWWVTFIGLVYTMKSGLTTRCMSYIRTKIWRIKVD